MSADGRGREGHHISPEWVRISDAEMAEMEAELEELQRRHIELGTPSLFTGGIPETMMPKWSDGWCELFAFRLRQYRDAYGVTVRGRPGGVERMRIESLYTQSGGQLNGQGINLQDFWEDRSDKWVRDRLEAYDTAQDEQLREERQRELSTPTRAGACFR